MGEPALFVGHTDRLRVAELLGFENEEAKRCRSVVDVAVQVLSGLKPESTASVETAFDDSEPSTVSWWGCG